jgi:hypothetical protein
MADEEQQAGAARSQRPRPLVCENFIGMNTATTRAGVDERQAYWIDGWIPLSPRNLRTMYGVGSPLYTAPAGKSIVCYYFYNLGATPYAFVFLSDGSAVQVNANTGATTTAMPAGTILLPSITSLGVSQYGQQYLIIVASQTNGYWVWDGTLLYGAGTLAPGVTLTNVGSGYSSPPTVSATGGLGTGSAFVATIANGEVTGVKITNPGSGYIATDQGNVTLVFTGGNSAGSQGTISANMSQQTGGSGASGSANWAFVRASGAAYLYAPISTNVIAGGSGYSSVASAAFSGGTNFEWYQNAPPAVVIGQSSGTVTGFGISGNPSNPSAYIITTQPNNFTFPTIAVTDPGFYYVSSTTINDAGSNYGGNATIAATGGGTVVYSQAAFTPVVQNGTIAEVNITNPGIFGSNAAPTLTVSSVATTAAGTVNLAPFGISGNTVQSYQGHVWVFNGPNFNFSAPGSVWNFATSSGGGSQQSSVNYLRVGYTQAISTNGFLFLIGDSSMDYISGVSTSTPSGGSPTTTFTQNNSDPEVGTPYPAAVTTLGQDILIANSTGVHLSSGGEFVKRSEPLDGVYNTVPSFGGMQLSAAKATIFGKRVWMVLVPIIDPVSGNQTNKLLMFRDDGKIWWAGHQNVALEFITSQEINSVYTAWGTDGIHIYQLFSTPTTGFHKTLQTRLWDQPFGYDNIKSAVSLFAIAQFFGVSDLDYTVAIDNENGNSSTIQATGAPTAFSWVDAAGAPFTWQNGSSQTFTWAATGNYIFSVLPPTAVGQLGVLLGMTVVTQADDMALVSVMVQPEEIAYRA